MLTKVDALNNVLKVIEESVNYRAALTRLSMAITAENLEWIKEIDWTHNVDNSSKD
jgi:hypothetical protein